MTRVPELADLEAARDRIGGVVRRTPVVEVMDLPQVAGRVVLKLELMQHSGSFKMRGALNSMLSLSGTVSGVCAASGGNHAAAVAWSARRAGLTADLFVPVNATPTKIARIVDYGGQVHLVEGFVKGALEECRAFSDRHGIPQLHPYDTVETVSGAGTVGLEIAEQVPDASLVVLGCGGGGLFAGTTIALAPLGIRVQPVEPEMCPALSEALAAGGPVDVAVGGVAGDSLGAPRIGDIGYAVAVEQGAVPVLVPESSILDARRELWTRLRVLAEPGACAAFAAVMSGRVDVPAGQTAVVVVSGGNNETLPS